MSLSSLVISAALLLPLQDASSWHSDEFSGIPANKLSFQKQGLTIAVDKSAGPLIHTLKSEEEVVGLRIRGEFLSLPVFAGKAVQGQKGADDYALRVGLVVPGDKKLSGIKKLFAPAWVKNLYARFPGDIGLDHVQFYNVTQDKSQLATSRVHPSTDLIQENVFASVDKPGAFSYDLDFPKPVKTLAIWISVDGDDTKSTFTIRLDELELKTKQ